LRLLFAEVSSQHLEFGAACEFKAPWDIEIVLDDHVVEGSATDQTPFNLYFVRCRIFLISVGHEAWQDRVFELFVCASLEALSSGEIEVLEVGLDDVAYAVSARDQRLEDVHFRFAWLTFGEDLAAILHHSRLALEHFGLLCLPSCWVVRGAIGQIHEVLMVAEDVNQLRPIVVLVHFVSALLASFSAPVLLSKRLLIKEGFLVMVIA
jgi:hypothetical protein